MSSRFKGKLCLHLRAKELTIFRYAIISVVDGRARAWVGVAGRWARRHAAPAVVGRFIFFSRLGLFWRFRAFGFWASRRRTTDDDDETGLPPLNPLVLRTENRQIFIAKFFFQKIIWRQNFFGDFKNIRMYSVASPLSDTFLLPCAPVPASFSLSSGSCGQSVGPTTSV